MCCSIICRQPGLAVTVTNLSHTRAMEGFEAATRAAMRVPGSKVQVLDANHEAILTFVGPEVRPQDSIVNLMASYEEPDVWSVL